MERRKETRLAVNSPVTVTVLGGPEQPPIRACVKDISRSGLRLSSPLPIPCGAPVKVEGGDLLLLGEVCRMGPVGERLDEYTIGIKVSHSLASLADLERLNRALLNTDASKKEKRAREKHPLEG